MRTDTIEWKSFKTELPDMFDYMHDGTSFRTFPILLQLNYHWVEETYIVVGYLLCHGGYWSAEGIPNHDEIPLDSLVAWAYMPDGLDREDSDYIWECDGFRITSDHLNKLRLDTEHGFSPDKFKRLCDRIQMENYETGIW